MKIASQQPAGEGLLYAVRVRPVARHCGPGGLPRVRRRFRRRFGIVATAIRLASHRAPPFDLFSFIFQPLVQIGSALAAAPPIAVLAALGGASRHEIVLQFSCVRVHARWRPLLAHAAADFF
jgi:hypothetical protein